MKRFAITIGATLLCFAPVLADQPAVQDRNTNALDQTSTGSITHCEKSGLFDRSCKDNAPDANNYRAPMVPSAPQFGV